MNWSSFRYSLYAPIYDLLALPLSGARRRAVDQAAIPDGADVLVVGVGTGLDLPLLPASCTVTAIDLSGTMLAMAARRARRNGIDVSFRQMDVQALDFPDDAFDVVLVHLIAAVVPDGKACVAEACRVLRPGGTMSLFDKFRADESSHISLARRVLGVPARFFFSEINRRKRDLIDGLPLDERASRPVAFGGLFHAYALRKVP